MYDAQSQLSMFHVRSAAVEFEYSGRDAIAIYQSHFSRKRVVLAFPLKSHGAEDSREPRGEEKGTWRRAKWKKMYRSPTEVNERHDAWHYSPPPPLPAASPRASPRRRPQILCRGERARLALARETPRRHKWSGNGRSRIRALCPSPSPSPSRAVRCKHAAGVRQVAANTRVRNNLTFDERVIVTVYDVVAFVTRPSYVREIESANKVHYYIPFYSTERCAPRTVISRASRRPGFADSIVSGLRRGRERRRERQPGGVVGKGATTRIYR